MMVKFSCVFLGFLPPAGGECPPYRLRPLEFVATARTAGTTISAIAHIRPTRS
jgi:hypothetical protein